MKGLKVRVQGAPIWSRTFQAIGMAPTVIAYNEVYNAIQNSVIAAGENEAAGRRADEVLRGGAAPVDDAARDHHPAAVLLEQDLQEAATRTCRPRCSRPARKPAPTAARSSRARTRQKLVALEKAGKLKRVPFADRAQMKKLVDPVMAAYAKEIGAEQHLRQDQRDQVASTPGETAAPHGAAVFLCSEK